MIKFTGIFVFLLLNGLPLYSQEQVSLQEALKDGTIGASFEANPKSLHYGKPLKGIISNKSSQKIQLLIENGTIFSCQNSQDILTTMPLLVQLQAGETKKIEILGLGIQSKLPLPKEGATYIPQTTNQKEYIAYAQFVAEEKLHNTAEAQYGLWVISEKQEIRQLMQRSLRKDIALKVRDFLIQLLRLNENLEDIPQEIYHKVLIDSNLVSTYTLASESISPDCEVRGGGNFTLKTPKEVRLVMLNTQGVLVRELYYNPKEKIGTHQLRYGYNCQFYKEEAYIIALVFDGKVHISTTLHRKR